MNVEKIINQLDIEKIYQTILDLEGPKHPFYNWNELENAAQYIYDKFKLYGIKTEFQEFYIKGYEKPFKNVLGYIGDPDEASIVLGSHYDTVVNTPGANDNLSAVALSLEIARILSQLDNPPSVIIAVFTLEEGYPSVFNGLYKKMRQRGWVDDQDRFKSLKLLNMDRKLNQLVQKKFIKHRQPIYLIYEAIKNELINDLSLTELDYLQICYESCKELDDLYSQRKFLNYALVGSTMFVDKIKLENIDVKYVINLDTLGWISNVDGTQKPLPIKEEMLPLTSTYRMDIKGTVGNFIAVMANQNAKHLLDEYINQFSDPKIDLPCFGLYLPFDIDTILASAPDTLRSDHAPFWAENIPGIFISDSANFRSPYYHTAEDNHTHINYEALLKITKATLNVMLKI